MGDELTGILADLGLGRDAVEDSVKFLAGELDLAQVRGLAAIELYKQPTDLQDRISSLFIAYLRSDRPATERFLRLFHKIGGVTLLFALYRKGGGFRDEFNELSRHDFLRLDMVRWIAHLASMCELRYLRSYAAVYLDRLYKENPEVLHSAANQSSPAGRIYLASFLVIRDPVKYVKLIAWLDESLVIVTMAYLFIDCGLTDGERDLIKKFLSGDEAVTTEALEAGLKPEVRKRIYQKISRVILNGLYYACSMAEAHSKVAKRFIQLIALIDFSLTLETSYVVREERGYFWVKDRQVHSVNEGKDAVLEAEVDFFEVLSMYFARDRSSAYMPAHKLEGSDPQTFEVLGEFDSQFARDRSSVYFYGQKIEGADSKTFEVLGGYHCYWAKDARKAYCFYEEDAPKVINTKNPEKFELVPDSYWTEHARDEQYVYYYGRRMKHANPATFRSVPCERFGGEELGCDYFMDDARIFYKGWEVVEADLGSFIVYWLPGLGHAPYGVDRNNAYYHGKPVPPVQAIDIMKTARQHPQFAEKVGEDAIRRMEEWDRTGRRPDGKQEAAGQIDYSRFKVEILQWGEFQVDRTEGRGSKTVSVLDKFRLKRRSSRIPAVKGVTFGINHLSTGETSPAINNLTIRLRHPPIKDPRSGRVSEKDEWDIPVGLDTLSHNSYSFDNDREVVEGRWVFQVIHGDTVLAEKAFEVRKHV